jgi:hypothetical protein
MRAVVGMLVILLAGAAEAHAAKAPPIVPATLYPRGASFTVRRHVPNSRFDTLWGFFGPAPAFHSRTADDLHRIDGGGFSQYAVSRHRKLDVNFALWSSSFVSGVDARTSQPFAAAAAGDFAANTRNLGLLPTATPTVVDGTHASAFLGGDPDGTMYAVALWRGAVEIEGCVLFPTKFTVYARTVEAYLLAEAEAALDIEAQRAASGSG